MNIITDDDRGDIYLHYKGGVYRHIDIMQASDNFKANETVRIIIPEVGDFPVKVTDDIEQGEDVMFYEHLWPHNRSFFLRPLSMWNDVLENGTKRFVKLVPES